MDVPKEVVQSLVEKLKQRTDLPLVPSTSDIVAHLRSLLSQKAAGAPTEPPIKTIVYYGGVIKLGKFGGYKELPKWAKNPLARMRMAWRTMR